MEHFTKLNKINVNENLMEKERQELDIDEQMHEYQEREDEMFIAQYEGGL